MALHTACLASWNGTCSGPQTCAQAAWCWFTQASQSLPDEQPSSVKQATQSAGTVAAEVDWLDEGEVRVFLGASAASSAALKIPERATYLGKASESSFINLVDAISRSMDIFIRDGAARVGVCTTDDFF